MIFASRGPVGKADREFGARGGRGGRVRREASGRSAWVNCPSREGEWASTPRWGKHEAHQRIVRRLEDQARDVKRLTAGLDDAVLARRVVEGKWSLKELAGHLWRVQQVFEGRLEAMLDGRQPADPVLEPRQRSRLRPDAGAGIGGGGERFPGRPRGLRRARVRLSPADWHRPGQHPDFPNYDVHFLLEYLAHHEAHHIYQMYVRRSGLGKIPHALSRHRCPRPFPARLLAARPADTVPRPMGLYLGVFLVTLSGLLFEIALTRIFSATIWYHFAFVAISVALLGWGLGGFLLHAAAGAPAALGRPGRALHPALCDLAAHRLVADRPAALPPGPDRLLLPGLASSLSPRGHRPLHGLRPAPRADGRPLLRRPPGRGHGRLAGDRFSCRGSGARAPCSG